MPISTPLAAVHGFCLGLLCCFALTASGPLRAQGAAPDKKNEKADATKKDDKAEAGKKDDKGAETKKQPAGSKEDVAKGPAKLPDARLLSQLVRTTVVALNQANITGNYSVLRDLGTPQFQFANSTARMAVAFTKLRRRGLDLSPIINLEPKWTKPPSVDKDGTMGLAGVFPSSPLEVVFELGFKQFRGRWRLAGIAVDAVSSQAKTAATPARKAGDDKGGASGAPGAKDKSGGTGASAGKDAPQGEKDKKSK